MKAQRNELVQILPKHGWEIFEVEIPNREWAHDWADEIITIESVWSPLGLRAHLFFLVDPLSEKRRRKGEEVWAIGVSTEINKTWDRWLYAPPMVEFVINKGHWNKSLPKLLAALAELRDGEVISETN